MIRTIPKGSQQNIFSTTTNSNLAILASFKRQGLPLVDRDDLQTQLVPTKSISQTENPLKLPLETRVRTPSLPSIQLTTNRHQKKKAVAFIETLEILETPKNKPNPPTDRSPTNPTHKGILIKKRKYSDHGEETKKESPVNENPQDQNLGGPINNEDNNEEGEKNDKTEKVIRNPPSFLDLIKDNNKVPKSVFSRPHRVKKSFTDEYPEGDIINRAQKEEKLADTLRKNFDFGLPREDLTIKKSLSSFISPRTNIKSEGISIFKGSSNKDTPTPIKLKKPTESPLSLINPTPVVIKNNSKIPSFNIGTSNDPPKNEQSSPRLLKNISSPSHGNRIKRKDSEDKFLPIDSPFENFNKKNGKNNSLGYDGRNQFAFSAANNILKTDNFRTENKIGLLPKLEIFNDYRRSLPGSYNNTPRKY